MSRPRARPQKFHSPADSPRSSDIQRRGYNKARASSYKPPEDIQDEIEQLVHDACDQGFPTYAAAMMTQLLREAIAARKARGPHKASPRASSREKKAG